MTKAEAIKCAEKRLETHNMRGYKAVLYQAKRDAIAVDEWNIIFELFSPEGFATDGPMIIIVDDKTGEATVFPSP